jgi:PAT family beta-lactamase induction signal transducer AmpG
LLIGGIIVCLSNLLFYFLATSEPNLLNLVTVISFDNFAGGFASTAFIAYLSGLTDKSYTATQYALFSSLMTLPGKFFSGFSGILVDSFGYQDFFIFSAALGLPGILMVSWLFYVNQQLKQVDVKNSLERRDLI